MYSYWSHFRTNNAENREQTKGPCSFSCHCRRRVPCPSVRGHYVVPDNQTLWRVKHNQFSTGSSGYAVVSCRSSSTRLSCDSSLKRPEVCLTSDSVALVAMWDYPGVSSSVLFFCMWNERRNLQSAALWGATSCPFESKENFRVTKRIGIPALHNTAVISVRAWHCCAQHAAETKHVLSKLLIKKWFYVDYQFNNAPDGTDCSWLGRRMSPILYHICSYPLMSCVCLYCTCTHLNFRNRLVCFNANLFCNFEMNAFGWFMSILYKSSPCSSLAIQPSAGGPHIRLVLKVSSFKEFFLVTFANWVSGVCYNRCINKDELNRLSLNC